MVGHSLKIASLLAATAALSGCASLFGDNFAKRAKSAPEPALALAPQSALTATEEGRRLLDEGLTGMAIDSFRKALVKGEPSAPAYNGLAVAYARLGSFENAEKLFRLAIAADPENPKYAENLSKLYTSPLLAMRKNGELAANVTKAPGFDAPPPAKADTPQAGKLTRVAAGEFRIQTLPPAASRPAPRAVVTLLKPKVAKPAAILAAEDALAPVKPAEEAAPAKPASKSLNNPFVPATTAKP